MEYRQLGHTGLRVSAIALGTMTFGGRGKFALVGETEIDEARQIVERALAAGVNLIDTADIYSEGRSEEIVGQAIKGRRDDIVLATKARFPMGSGENDGGLSRRYLISACEASLRRLGTDYIDLYQVHERDGVTPMEETLDTLNTLVHQGKVRYIGVSNHSGWHVAKALGISARLGLQRYVTQQIYYSLLDRHAEYELIPLSIDEDLGVLVWSPLAGGLLSGKYRRDVEPPTGARQTTPWGEPPVYDEDRMYRIIDVLVDVAEERGVSPAQTALAYLLGRPAVTSLIIGARNEEQLVDNLGCVDAPLSDAERARLDDVSALPLIYPYWHQANTAAERLSPGDESLLGQRREQK